MMGLDAALRAFFARQGKAALGFSGGVDSAYLLWAAKAVGADVRPYFVKTPFQPEFELEDARRLAEELGIGLEIVELDILGVPEVAENPENRCYYCKKAIFSALKERAEKDGYTRLLDGTNASDQAGDRPGMRALGELEVRSPLRECGLEKSRIRELSREAGLFTWDKPAYACLATRVPAGTAICRGDLRRIEEAEARLRELGFSDLRVRLFHGAARIQLPEGQIGMAAGKWTEIREALAPGFETVLLDLKGR